MNNNLINIYSDIGLRQIPFHEVDNLKSFIGDSEVLYITGAVKTKAWTIASLVRSVEGYDIPKKTKKIKGLTSKDVSRKAEKTKEKKKVLRATGRGSLKLPKMAINFKYPWDIYFIDTLKKTYGKNIMEEDEALVKMLKQGFLEVTTYKKAKEKAQEWEKLIAKREKLHDDALDAIIVDSSIVQDAREGKDVSTEDGHFDAVDIEIGDGGVRKLGGKSVYGNEANMPY